MIIDNSKGAVNLSSFWSPRLIYQWNDLHYSDKR